MRLIDYMRTAFGAQELACLAGEDGSIEHAEVRIGDSVVMMFDARPEWPPTPGFLRLYVEDADAVHRQAVVAGGTSVTEVTRRPGVHQAMEYVQSADFFPGTSVITAER
ncbi:putative glyoxalase superfamily protein PhnB [Streptomyces griseochromogenes]|uniref:Glyoxalase superfamily protein PhnB n=1 Tax=Streptomyces griseochromogenes TaxID=68214 RepID=A0ABS4M3P0_9ACTN|nr:VOC family protein [Streptomyces griseochromogenes]MBP2054294.1 putative glyoxalase superfamily protein PhnB [Streptomyces griseochromogenes]